MKTAYFMPKKSDLLFECKMNSSFWYHGKKLWPKTISNAEHKPIKSTSIGQKEHLYTHLPKWSESFEWLGIGLLPASSPTMLRAASEAGKWRKIKPSSRYRTWFINKADCNYEHIMNYMTWNYTIPKHSNTSVGSKFAPVEGLSHDLVCTGSIYHVHFAWQVWHGQLSPRFKFN